MLLLYSIVSLNFFKIGSKSLQDLLQRFSKAPYGRNPQEDRLPLAAEMVGRGEEGRPRGAGSQEDQERPPPDEGDPPGWGKDGLPGG